MKKKVTKTLFENVTKKCLFSLQGDSLDLNYQEYKYFSWKKIENQE